jgi:hypothetical protein
MMLRRLCLIALCTYVACDVMAQDRCSPLQQFLAARTESFFIEETEERGEVFYGVTCRGIEDFSGLPDEPIKSIAVAYSDISDISALTNLPLISVAFFHTQNLKDIAPLAHTKITSLVLHDTGIDSIEFLSGMSLTNLFLDSPRIQDISALSNMPLQSVFLGGTAVQDVHVLRGMPISEISLPRSVADISPVLNAPLRNISLGEESLDASLEKLKAIKTLESINGVPVTRWTRDSNGHAYERELTPIEKMRRRDKLRHGQTGSGRVGEIPEEDGDVLGAEGSRHSTIEFKESSGRGNGTTAGSD